MEGQDYVRLLANSPQPLEQVLRERRRLGLFFLIALIIVSILPASLIAYWAGFIPGKTAVRISALVVILFRVVIGKPTFYSAPAKKS